MTAVDVPHVAPPNYVSPPQPEPASYGLLSVANIVDDDTLWQMGLEWEPLPAAPAGLVSIICPPADGSDPAGLPLTPESGVDTARSLPFGVYGSYSCSTFSRPGDEAENRARQHLALAEETAVEQAIAAGGFDNTPTLQGAADLTPGGGAVPLGIGVGKLESRLATTYGGIGVIHAPRVTAANFPAVGPQGQRMVSRLGNLVAFGAGYDLANTGPDGVAPPDGEAWMYVTPRPIVRRSDVIVTPDTDQRPDRRTNDYTIIAQRVYLVGWDPQVKAAIRVQVGVPEGGTTSSTIDGGTA